MEQLLAVSWSEMGQWWGCECRERLCFTGLCSHLVITQILLPESMRNRGTPVQSKHVLHVQTCCSERHRAGLSPFCSYCGGIKEDQELRAGADLDLSCWVPCGSEQFKCSSPKGHWWWGLLSSSALCSREQEPENDCNGLWFVCKLHSGQGSLWGGLQSPACVFPFHKAFLGLRLLSPLWGCVGVCGSWSCSFPQQETRLSLSGTMRKMLRVNL